MNTRAQKRVLVVEDDDAVRALLRQELAGANFDVVAAVDGIHALRVFATGRPDVIVLDFNLPGISGPQLLQRWRSRDSWSPVPIVGVSGLPEGASIARDFEVDAFFAKPFDVEEVIQRVRSLSAERHN